METRLFWKRWNCSTGFTFIDLSTYHFRAVAEEGNLTCAAEKLNLSQSALSTRIRRLEARRGHDLPYRVARTVQLTEVGWITQHAARIFATRDEGLAMLRRLVREGGANAAPKL